MVKPRADGLLATEPDALWLTVSEERTIAGVAVRTPPRGLLLGSMPDEAARTLAQWCVAEGLRLPSAGGPVDVAETFAVEYAAGTGCAMAKGRSSRMFRLAELCPPTGVAGQPRAARRDDRPLLVEWSRRFGEDVHNVDADPAPPVDSRLTQPDLIWLWEYDGEPVSMAWLTPPVSGVSRVSGVYTPDGRRGHGYASACVAHVSAYAIEHGSSACMLYTDLANPISNKIYQRIGYQPVADAQDWLFNPRAE